MSIVLADQPIADAHVVIWLQRLLDGSNDGRLTQSQPIPEAWVLRRAIYPDAEKAQLAVQALMKTEARCASVSRLIDTLNVRDWPW